MMGFIKKQVSKIDVKKLLHFVCQLLLVALYLIVLALGGCQKKEDVEPSKKTASLHAVVKDLTPPVISSTQDVYNIKLGTAFQLQDEITVMDNMDGELAFQCADSFDVHKAGQYILQITAEDASGNTASKNITVNVVSAASNPKKDLVNPPAQAPASSVPATVPPVQPGITSKSYLFTDGYTISNVAQVCQADLLASGRGGSCHPITDEHGIYIGMELILQ